MSTLLDSPQESPLVIAKPDKKTKTASTASDVATATKVN
jgi:hypothetical protein